MAFVHGKKTFISLDGTDLSTYTNESELTREADSHDVTTYGKNAHIYQGGLTDGTATMSGIYDDTTDNGPRATIQPLIGSNVELIRQPEGAGSGLPQDVVNVLVTNYVETAPVAEMSTWSAELQLSGEVDTTAQNGGS